MAKGKQKPPVAVAAVATLASGELSQSLDQLQYEANSWAESVERHAYRAVEAGIECGRRLVAIKARLGHGGWSKWIGTSFDYDMRTAQRYMSLAEYAGEIANQPTITRALAVIADLREEERAEEGRPSRRKPEEAAQAAFDRTFSAEALGRHIDAADPDEADEAEEADEEPERDEQPRPTIRQVSEASRKPQRPEPVRIKAPQLLPEAEPEDIDKPAGDLIEGQVFLPLRNLDFAVEVDSLCWVGYDGVEQESDPLQLLEYVARLLSEAEKSERQRVAAVCRRVADVLEEEL